MIPPNIFALIVGAVVGIIVATYRNENSYTHHSNDDNKQKKQNEGTRFRNENSYTYHSYDDNKRKKQNEGTRFRNENSYTYHSYDDNKRKKQNEGTRFRNENSYTYHSYDDNKRKQNERCIFCEKTLSTLISLSCGHGVHELCFYDKLISCKTDLQKYKCPSCHEPVPYNLIEQILCSRCCVCKDKFDSKSYTYELHLTCGHKLHKECLDADILRQSVNGEMYKCPYKLLKCNKEMDISSISSM